MALDVIERLIRQLAPDIAEAFLAAIAKLVEAISFRRLVAALEAGDVARAVDLVGLEPARFRPLERSVFVAYETGGVDITAGIDRRRRANVQALFNVNEPEAKRWLEGHTTDLIRQITEDQRRLIERELSPLRSGLDPMVTGQTPQKLALDLVGRVNRATGKREGGILGLTSQQAEWARRYEGELAGVPDAAALSRTLRDKRFDKAIRRAIAEDRPLDAKTRQGAVEAYRNRALRYRAETIAENEAHTVLHQAQQDAWDQAVGRGVVAASRVRRFWITAGDDRVRPHHAAVPGMNEKGVGLKEPFQTPRGPAMLPGWRFEAGCRCRVRVRINED